MTLRLLAVLAVWAMVGCVCEDFYPEEDAGVDAGTGGGTGGGGGGGTGGGGGAGSSFDGTWTLGLTETDNLCNPDPVPAVRTMTLALLEPGGTASFALDDGTVLPSSELTFSDGGLSVRTPPPYGDGGCVPGCGDGGAGTTVICQSLRLDGVFTGPATFTGTLRSNVERDVRCALGSSLCFIDYAVDAGKN